MGEPLYTNLNFKSVPEWTACFLTCCGKPPLSISNSANAVLATPALETQARELEACQARRVKDGIPLRIQEDAKCYVATADDGGVTAAAWTRPTNPRPSLWIGPVVSKDPKDAAAVVSKAISAYAEENCTEGLEVNSAVLATQCGQKVFMNLGFEEIVKRPYMRKVIAQEYLERDEGIAPPSSGYLAFTAWHGV